MTNKMFEYICRLSQKSLKKFVAKKLKETHDKIIERDGFVYTQGTFPVLLVAHLDTVYKQLPEKIVYDNATDTLSSPQGIGGDDRCGVYMVLEVVKKFNCSVLFCEDEEVGGVGADKFVKSDIAKNLEFNYIIEFDRRGENDAVFYDCDNKDFEKFITKEFYKTSWGSFSDISFIAPSLKCAAVNLSCGYYNAHTKNEFVVLSEMNESINQACKILERTTDKDKFEYIEIRYDKWDLNWDSFGDDKHSLYDEKCYFIEYYDVVTNKEEWEEIFAHSKVEAVGEFCMSHPDIPYSDIYIYDVSDTY